MNIFTPAKTIEEAYQKVNEYTKGAVDFSENNGITLETINAILSALYSVRNIYNFNLNGIIILNEGLNENSQGKVDKGIIKLKLDNLLNLQANFNDKKNQEFLQMQKGNNEAIFEFEKVIHFPEAKKLYDAFCFIKDNQIYYHNSPLSKKDYLSDVFFLTTHEAGHCLQEIIDPNFNEWKHLIAINELDYNDILKISWACFNHYWEYEKRWKEYQQYVRKNIIIRSLMKSILVLVKLSFKPIGVEKRLMRTAANLFSSELFAEITAIIAAGEQKQVPEIFLLAYNHLLKNKG